MRTPRALRLYANGLDKRRYFRAQRQRAGKPIVILTMGKTGSATIMATLEEHVPERPVYQVHRFAPNTLALAEREYGRIAPQSRSSNILAARYLRTRMPTPEKPWDVISLVRDPVARGVSAYFQTGARLGHTVDDPEIVRTELLAWPAFRITNTWFDTELRDGLGIDVHDYPFDPEMGYQRIETPAVRLLLIRQENLDQAPGVLSDFLNTPVPSLVNANVASDKPYAEMYRRFCSWTALPASASPRAWPPPSATSSRRR